MRGRGRQQRGRQSRQFYELANIYDPAEEKDPYDDYDEEEEGNWDYRGFHQFDNDYSEQDHQQQPSYTTYDYVDDNNSPGNFMFADDPSFNYIDAAGNQLQEEDESFEYFTILKDFEEIQLSSANVSFSENHSTTVLSALVTTLEDPKFTKSLTLPSVLADSGAAMNFLNPKLFDQLAKNNATYDAKPNSVMLGDETTTKTSGSVQLLMQFELMDVTIVIKEVFHRLQIHHDAVLSNAVNQSTGNALYFADPHPDKRLFKALYGKQQTVNCEEDVLEEEQEVFSSPEQEVSQISTSNPITNPV
jgi:hypothetical protein